MKKIKNKLFLKKVPIGVLVPALLVFVFFVLTIFSFLLPYMEEALIDKKREMIYELVSTAHSSMEMFEEKVQKGELTEEQAQSIALDYLRGMRYGYDNENAFWVHDRTSTMLVHKSKSLEGRSLQSIKEPIVGERSVFIETGIIAKEQGEGFIDFLWGEGVPVVSYFRLFEPWDWVIGTNISFVDIYVDINHIIEKVKKTAIVIVGIIMLLLAYNIWTSVRVGKSRIKNFKKL